MGKNVTETNPFASAPIDKTVAPLAEGDFPLATLWQRFLGNLLDSVLILIVMFIPYGGLLIAYGFFIDPSYLESESYQPRHMQDFLVESTLGIICVSATFLALNGYLLAKHGQTIGKVVMKTRMVGDDNQLVPLKRVFLMRYLWLWIVAYLGIIGNVIFLINSLAILGDERKCGHDMVASTKVISLR